MNRRYPRYPDDADYQTNAPSYYEDLARKNKLIKKLAKRIWEYDKTLANSLEELKDTLNNYIVIVDDKLEFIDNLIGDGFGNRIEALLREWVNDGTLNHIINEEVFNDLKLEIGKEINDLRTRNKYVKNTDRAINHMIEVGLTYYDREDFEYGNNNTMVSWDNPGVKIDGKYQIDCSSFMHALLMDIPFEKSAYVNNGVNYPNSNGFKFDTEKDKYPYNTVKPELMNTRMLANDIAYFAYVNGWQHYIKDNDFSTIEVGDFIFHHSSYDEGFYDDIGHIGVVIDIQVNNENIRNFTILESAGYSENGVSIEVKSENTLIKGKIKSFARFPLSDKGGLAKNINLVKNENTHLVKQDDFVTVDVNQKLEYYKPYTIYFEVDDLITNAYPRITVYDMQNNYRGTVFSFSQKKYRIGGNKSYYATFFIDKRIKDLSNSVIQIGLLNTQEQIFSYKVSNILLYTNYVNVSQLNNNFKEVDYYEKDNGTSIKLDDGTLIQTHRINDHEYIMSEEVNGVYRDTNEWVFPIEFKTPPVVSVSTTGAGIWSNLQQTPNTTKCMFNVFCNIEKSLTLNTFLIAIGRWK